MGRSGTDVAREASEIVITDDEFTSIVSAIEEGRYAYDNVRKVTYVLLSTGAGEVLLVTAALAMGLPLPLSAVQLLWLNLATNGIQDVALAFRGSGGRMASSLLSGSRRRLGCCGRESGCGKYSGARRRA